MKLFYEGKTELAIPKLEEALKILPRAKATEIDYTRASTTLSECYYKLGDAAYRANDNKKALDHAKKALQYDPSNRSAENLVVKVKQAEREKELAARRPPSPVEQPAPDKDPAFEAKKDQIRKLFREGKLLLNSGQYDEAENRFQQVLLIDPYNSDAQELLRLTYNSRRPSSVVGQTAERERMLWQVDDAWVPPIGGEVKIPTADQGGTKIGVSASAVAAIQQKLNEIIFPEIRFRQASLADVVQYLSEESRKLDPKRDGVNIVLGPGVQSGTTPEAAPGAELPDAPAAATADRPITLSLKNVPMIEALRYVTSLANLKYRIESSAVLILPPDAPDQAMVTRTYPVTPGVFSKFAATPGAATGGGGDEFRALGTGPTATITALDIKSVFTDAGVAFPVGSSIVYNERTSTVIIRNTPENIEAFERVLPSFDAIPLQVEIEAKFVEVSQNDLDELGFKWKVGPYRSGDILVEGGSPSTVFGSGIPNAANSDDITAGLRDSTGLGASAVAGALAGAGGAAGINELATIKGILTDPQFELIIKALSQKKSADVLSAPKVTTLSGVQAQIKVVQEFIYPSEYTEPQVDEGGITPTIPSSFKTREIGVILNVTPTVGADKYTINLALTPEVSEFLGFLDYSPGNVSFTSNSNTNSILGGQGGVVSVPYRVEQPLFSTRSLATSVVIWDGQTVVLGGLIREDVTKIDDKVPFLGDLPVVGRLFRSKATVRGKRNLLIFVSAKLIDPAGNRLHKEMARSATR
jgi:general secretion pathway protein D